MKKTLIALIALSSVTFGAAERGDHLWTMTFGTNIGTNGTDDYTVVGSYAPSDAWDINDQTGVDYVSTNGSNKRVHTQWKNGSGLNLSDNFEVEIVFTLPESYTHNDNPYLIMLNTSTEDNGTNGNFLAIALNSGTLKDEEENFVYSDNYITMMGNATVGTSTTTLATGVEHTAILRLLDGTVSLTLNGAVIQTGTLNSGVSGDIKNVFLGGQGGDSAHRLAENVHSVSAYKVIPEPTTATLSLLALAGLAARRRRR